MGPIAKLKLINLAYKIVTAYDDGFQKVAKEKPMKLKLNYILQGLAVSLQLVNQYGALVPAKWQGYVMAGVTVSQGVAGILAHFANPDGTPAAVAYVPKA